MQSPVSSRLLLLLALFPLSCLSTCPNHALLGCVLRLKAQRVPFEKNMMNVVFNIATEAKLLRTCRVYSNTMPCFREKIVECGDDKQKRMLDEVGRMLMFICSPFSLQRQRHLIKHQRCISAVLNLPPTTDCPVEDPLYSRDLAQCRTNCVEQQSNFLCTMQTWMSEQNVCTQQSLHQKCGAEAAGLYEQMQVTVFEPHFPIICDRVARPTQPPPSTRRKVTSTSKAPTSSSTISSSVSPTSTTSAVPKFSTTSLPISTSLSTVTSSPNDIEAEMKLETTTIELITENTKSTGNSVVDAQQRQMKNQTIADLWEAYAASSDKYHKKLSELWKNKKLGLLIDSASNGTLLTPSTTSAPLSPTTLPPRPSTERPSTTTSTTLPTTSAVKPRTIKVINILKRLLPDYIPQLSSIFEHVQEGKDLFALGVTAPASTAPPPTTLAPTTTYFAKKSSFKRPPQSVLSPKVPLMSVPAPTLPPTNQRAMHRMAPRIEQRTDYSTPSTFYARPTKNESASPEPSTPPPTTLLSTQLPYTPQFPIASLDPNFSPRMIRLPEAIFAAGYQNAGVTMPMASPTMAQESAPSTEYRISYLPTGGTPTLAPTKISAPSAAASFPDFIKSLSNIGPIPAKEMTQQFFAYPPSNPKFVFAAPQKSDVSSTSDSQSTFPSAPLTASSSSSEERVIRRADRWKPWYLGSSRRI